MSSSTRVAGAPGQDVMIRASRIVISGSSRRGIVAKLNVPTTRPECAGMTSYEALSSDAKSFIEKIEEELSVPVTIIGTGPSILEIIDRRN